MRRPPRLTPRVTLLALLTCATACGSAPPHTTAHAAEEAAPEISWRSWDRATFEEAQANNKLLLVSVQAAWCHWCHVMNHETYGDPEVRRMIAERFVAIKVDSDARPDLAERYRNYAWPATALLTPEAEALITLRGYRAPGAFRDLLARAVQRVDSGDTSEPVAETGSEEDTTTMAEVADIARRTLDAEYDAEAHGWGAPQKYPYEAPVMAAFLRGVVTGDEAHRTRALMTLRGYAQLLDDVDGGMFQYSLRDRWDAPHFEKITAIQAGALLNFAYAYRLTGDATFRDHAESVLRYMQTMRVADGGFFTSQDADVNEDVTGEAYYAMNATQRRATGTPRIDRQVYANLNGKMIVGLVELAIAEPASRAGELAITAARYLEDHLRRGEGFAHFADAPDDALFHLDDQAQMARAEMALFEFTGEAAWLARARRTADFVLANLMHDDGGFYAHTRDENAVGVFARRRRPIVGNGYAALALLRIARVSPESRYRAEALRALQAIASEENLAREGRKIGPYLWAVEEAVAPFVVLHVVGPDDESTNALHSAALQVNHPQRTVELSRPQSSRYPYPGRSAVYMCSDRACSRPIFAPFELSEAAFEFLSTEGR